VISETERRGQAYLFKLRLTKRVKQVLERAMRDDDWRDAGAGCAASELNSCSSPSSEDLRV
jgi:hypothetical protein